MDVDATAGEVGEDALVGGRVAANIVVLREAVNGDGGSEARQAEPLHGNGNDAAGDDHGEDAAAGKLRKNQAKLAMTYKRFAADQSNVQRLEAVDESDDAADQVIATFVGELAQGDFAAEVVISVGIAARTMQRALARDLDGEQGSVAEEDLTPRPENVSWSQSLTPWGWRNEPKNGRTSIVGRTAKAKDALIRFQRVVRLFRRALH